MKATWIFSRMTNSCASSAAATGKTVYPAPPRAAASKARTPSSSSTTMIFLGMHTLFSITLPQPLNAADEQQVTRFFAFFQ